MTSPKAPDNNTINARLAVAFGGWTRSDLPELPWISGGTYCSEHAIPPYTDSLALAVELLRRARQQGVFAWFEITEGTKASVRLFEQDVCLVQRPGRNAEEAISLALYAAGVSLGLIKEEQ